MNGFDFLSVEEMLSVDGGVNGGLIWTGVITIAGGVVGCCMKGGQVCGELGIYTGVVSLSAGLVY